MAAYTGFPVWIFLFFLVPKLYLDVEKIHEIPTVGLDLCIHKFDDYSNRTMDSPMVEWC